MKVPSSFQKDGIPLLLWWTSGVSAVLWTPNIAWVSHPYPYQQRASCQVSGNGSNIGQWRAVTISLKWKQGLAQTQGVLFCAVLHIGCGGGCFHPYGSYKDFASTSTLCRKRIHMWNFSTLICGADHPSPYLLGSQFTHQEHLYCHFGLAILDVSTSQNAAMQCLLQNDTRLLKRPRDNYSTSLNQRYIIVLLYFSLNGDHWINIGGLLSAHKKCEWEGVIWNHSLNMVTAINFRENNFIGSSPHDMFELRSLEYLDLEHNLIRGCIPKTLVNLDVVVFLDTGSCSVKQLWGGDVPTSFMDCSEPRLHC